MGQRTNSGHTIEMKFSLAMPMHRRASHIQKIEAAVTDLPDSWKLLRPMRVLYEESPVEGREKRRPYLDLLWNYKVAKGADRCDVDEIVGDLALSLIGSPLRRRGKKREEGAKAVADAAMTKVGVTYKILDTLPSHAACPSCYDAAVNAEESQEVSKVEQSQLGFGSIWSEQ